MTQNPDTKEYFMVCRDEHCDYFMGFHDELFCEECGKKYVGMPTVKICKSCQLNSFKRRFTDWTSRNEKIDNFIKEITQNELIPYNQFININKLYKGYSAIWIGNQKNKKNKKVILRHLYDNSTEV
jgi:hypothetical protein